MEVFLTFLWAEISLLFFRKQISPMLDKVFLNIIGKTFSQRSFLFQILILSFAAIVIAFVIRKILLYQKANTLITVNCVAWILVLLAIICAMQTIRRDDYWEIHDAKLYGFPGFITYEYLNINGRYFSLFLKSLYQFVPPTAYINTLLAVNILLLCIGCIYLMKIIDSSLSHRMKIIGGICLSLGMIFMSPNIWEVWFWGGGMFIYGIGITMCIWAAALMIDISLRQDQTLRQDQIQLKALSAAFFIFCACGTSELVTISVCLFSLMITVLPKLIRKSKWNRTNIFLTLFAWTIAAVILTTSGDLRDASGLSGSNYDNLATMVFTIPEKALLAVDKIALFFFSRIEYAAFFSFIAFFLGFCGPATVSGKTVAVSALVLIPTAIASLLVNALIDFIPVRVISIPLDWVYLAVFLCMLYMGSRLRTYFLPEIETGVVSGVLFLALLTVVGFFYISNIGMVRDIRTAWIARDQVLSAMRESGETVTTCAIPVLGSGQADPSDDPTRRKPDISLAKEKLGWTPKVDIREGLSKTIEYFAKLIRENNR